MKDKYIRPLTPSEIKSGYLMIVKEYHDKCPSPNENIIVKSNRAPYMLKLKMHSSQRGRIDGLTDLYKRNNTKSGDNLYITFLIPKKEIYVSFDENDNNIIGSDYELFRGDTIIGFSKDFKGDYVIPDYITTIGEEGEDGPFCGCKGLENVQIPDSVITINCSAFCNCTSIKKIFIPKNVSFISLGIFKGCTNLSSIIVDKDNNHYDSRENCNAIIDSRSHILVAGCFNSHIPYGVKVIEKFAFSDCHLLTEITIPDSVTCIESNAFSGCLNLNKIDIPEGVTTIENEAFYGCSHLSYISLPNSLKVIGGDVSGGHPFSNCEKLKEIIIPVGTRKKFEDLLPEDLHDKLIELKTQTELQEAQRGNTVLANTKSKSETGMAINSKNTAFSKKEFLELIEELRTTFQENEWCFRASEENVRAELIDPILKVLGWRMPYLRREFDHMDYVLCDDKALKKISVKLVIEAKKYREQLLTDKPYEKADQLNQQQIMKYMNKEHISIPFAILTNGIRWCLFMKDNHDCLGEIDIIHSTDEKIYSFFNSISKGELKNLVNMSKCQLDNPKQEKRPNIIKIGGTPRKTQKEACVEVAKDFLNKTSEPKNYCFTQEIIINKSANHNEVEIYKKELYIINHYRGIFEQLMLLQEINSTLDLGLSITAE